MPQLVSTWTAHARSWLGAPGFRIMTIRYEDLAADTPAQLAGIAGFLGLDSNHDAVARAVEAADFQNLQRQEAASGFRERPEGMPRFFRQGRAGGVAGQSYAAAGRADRTGSRRIDGQPELCAHQNVFRGLNLFRFVPQPAVDSTFVMRG